MAEIPASMGDHLGNAGPLPELNYNGKTLKVAYPDDYVKAKIELAIAQEVIAEAKELSAIDPTIVDFTKSLLAKREHRNGGELFRHKMVRLEGQCLLLWACVSYVPKQEWFSQSDALKCIQENGAEAAMVLELVMPPFLSLLAGRMPLPLEAREAAVAVLTAQLKTAIPSN